MKGKLKSYKGVVLNEITMCELCNKEMVRFHLTEIISALRMDESYSKEDAIHDLLDIVTEDLDIGFHGKEDQIFFRLAIENGKLKQQLAKQK